MSVPRREFISPAGVSLPVSSSTAASAAAAMSNICRLLSFFLLPLFLSIFFPDFLFESSIPYKAEAVHTLFQSLLCRILPVYAIMNA